MAWLARTAVRPNTWAVIAAFSLLVALSVPPHTGHWAFWFAVVAAIGAAGAWGFLTALQSKG